MKKLGQIDIKNQYGLKRKEFRHHYAAHGSLPQGKLYGHTQDKNTTTEPLQGSVQTHISFKGFNISAKKALKPLIKPVPEKLTKKVFDSLKNISDEQYRYYTEIKNNYINFLKDKKNPASIAFRKQNSITEEVLSTLDENHLIYLPKQTVLSKFLVQVVSPFKGLYRWGEKLILKKDSPKLKARKEKEAILKDFAALEGLIKSHEIWENGYRKLSGHQKWNENNSFLIPDKVLYSKITRRRNKIVDPNKGKYSSNSLMIGNRLISGIVYSYFLGTDAYNTTMRYSNNEHEAAAQRNSRIAQEFSRIGLNMYIQNLLFGTFETAVNRSLPTAMFVSGSTVAFSEILGRKLVGKPIMPSDKDTLDRLEKEMYEKKGILPAIGRLLTNVKKKEYPAQKYTPAANMPVQKSNVSNSTFGAFTKKEEQKSSTPSFKGFYKVDKIIDKNRIKQVVNIIEQADSKIGDTIKDSIIKSAKKSQYYKENKIPVPQNYEELIAKEIYKDVPVGTQETVWGKLTKSILVPVNFVKNLGKSTVKFTNKAFNFISGRKNNELLNELNSLSKSEKEVDKKRLEKFNKFFEERMSYEAWAKSPLSDEEKRLRIFSEFKGMKNKGKEDIEGAKNILLWIDKQIKKEGIKVDENGKLSPEDLKKVKNIMKASVMRADGEKQLEYDGNTLAQTNINLSRAITTLFLVTDAYNLTMQYSNDNRKDANKSAKNRAAQEISRISVSAYIMAFVHNLLSKLCNSSLAGAFTLTALTSSINDSISREVVGVPLTAKTQKELEEIDKKNQKSKSPIKKALAYSIGKKTAASTKPQIENKQETQKDFSQEFLLTPSIN